MTDVHDTLPEIAPPGLGRRILTRRVWPRPRAPSAAALEFSVRGGPIVAVCGLAGGAGTTTLAWLLAHGAARESVAQILLAELPAASGGVVALTGLEGTTSFGRIVARAAAGEAVRAGPVSGPDGLRVLASAPEPLLPDGTLEALNEVLAGMQAEHGLVVLDCGALQAPDARAAVALATHVVWTSPAGRAAGERARALLVDDALAPPPGGAREVLAMTATRPAAPGPRGQRTLCAIASERCDRVVLIPHVRELAAGHVGKGSRQLSTALAAIGGVLRLRARGAGAAHPSSMSIQEDIHVA